MDNKREADDNYKWKKKKRNRRRGNQQKAESDARKARDIEENELPKGKKSTSCVITKNGTNDVNWYLHVPGYDNYGNLPFNYPLGTKLPVALPGNYSYQADDATKSVAVTTVDYGLGGVMEINFAPTVGHNMTSDDPVNIAAQLAYTKDRAANSGASNYEKTDLMMLMIAMDSAYMLYSELVRAYRSILNKNSMNRYIPYTLTAALGFEHDMLASNLNNFEGLIKSFAWELMSVDIPDCFDYLSRHQWIVSNVYADSESEFSQLYLFKPSHYYVWVEGTSAQPTHLQLITRKTLFGLSSDNDEISSISQILSAIRMIMNPILGSDDVGNISGDLRKAFGEGGLVKLAIPSDAGQLTPIMDMEVLNEISNMNFLNLTDQSILTGDITQYLTDTKAGPYLLSNPSLNGASVFTQLKQAVRPVMNLRNMPVDYKSIITSSRLQFVLTEQNSSGVNELRATGSEIVTKVRIWGRNTSTGTFTANAMDQLLYTLANNFQGATQLARISQWSAFDYTPILPIWRCNGTGADDVTTAQFIGFYADFNDYTTYSKEDLTQLSELCMRSLFNLN